MEPASPSTESLFDRKFVVTATIIGAAYVALVLIISKFSREAANVASVALAALATGLFKKFESLRFQQLAESKYQTIALPHLHWWGFILATAWCLFLMAACSMIIILPFAMPHVASHLNDPDPD